MFYIINFCHNIAQYPQSYMIQNYIQDMKILYQKLHEYIDSSINTEENYQNLIQVINDQKIDKTKHELVLFLRMISEISNNINRSTNINDKIKKILINFKETISQTYSNYEIYNIFDNNKILLLFLLKENIIAIDEYIAKKIRKTPYFAPEIKDFFEIKEAIALYNQNPNLFEENRQKGENEGEICRLIREDLIDEFITYVNKNDISLNSKVAKSIFETNPLLLTKTPPTLIEYSAFYGSTQIFKYLSKNNAKLTSSLWIYSIHSDNPEMIKLLEENGIKPNDESYYECYKESIKCHHNDVAQYIENNFINSESKDKKINIKIFLKYYNFTFINFDCQNPDLFLILCKYDYATLAKLLLETKSVDINCVMKKIICAQKKQH